MENRVMLRELRNGDLEALENIVRITWGYDRFATPKTAKKLARVYLASCLANQTYARVAEVNGYPVGVILGKKIRGYRCQVKRRFHQIGALFSLICSREGREILRFFNGITQIDSLLLEKCVKEYDGEIALFAMAPEYRGLGVGKKLFEALLKYMKSEDVKEFYLFTDTSCNFGFYEHQGMKRRQQYSETVNMGGETRTMEFYLYDMEVPWEE